MLALALTLTLAACGGEEEYVEEPGFAEPAEDVMEESPDAEDAPTKAPADQVTFDCTAGEIYTTVYED